MTSKFLNMSLTQQMIFYFIKRLSRRTKNCLPQRVQRAESPWQEIFSSFFFLCLIILNQFIRKKLLIQGGPIACPSLRAPMLPSMKIIYPNFITPLLFQSCWLMWISKWFYFTSFIISSTFCLHWSCMFYAICIVIDLINLMCELFCF